MSGQRVGHYQILGKIGAGGMGEVFRARDERLHRDVALKLIRPASSENPDHIRRFELEARAAAALNHPNIVSIYDVGFDQGLHYIVSELLEGQTLRERLSAGPISSRQATDYVLQIVQGLAAAHERGIVHRDLKPENIFLTREGRIKILDFGVAKLQSIFPNDADTKNVQSMATVTKSGAIVGTVAYMSPEQLRGKQVDHRSDIFSVGAILYEMLTGRRAFAGETEVDTMTAVLREEPPEMDLAAANIPSAFQEIARHCLEKEPENRFQSARDLAFALQTLSGSGEAKALSATKRKPVAAWALPWIAAATVFIALGLVLLGKQLRPTAPPITYRQLTYEQGTVYSARFARDGQEIIYDAAWNGKPQQLFSTVGNSLLSQPLQISGVDLLALSSTNELAIATHGIHGAHLDLENATLAQVPMAAASPREILQGVTAADWDTKGQLALVHLSGGQNKIEYPIGHVLYQTSGRITHICISQRGDQIAFMNHPDPWDDRGRVAVVDLAGNVRFLTPEWDSEDGLGWSPSGREVWFAAGKKGSNRSLHAVDLAGHIRTLLEIPGSLSLQDVISDGRVLVTLNSTRLGMDAATLGNHDEVNLSWHDWTVARDISADGQWVLFEDSSEVAGPNYAVVMRKINGELPVRLGEGVAGGLSPDGRWAISISQGSPQKLVLLPVQAGEPRQIDIGNLQNVRSSGARFLSDGKRIVINANEPGRVARCFVLDLNGGKPPRPVTPEGIDGSGVSANGKYVIGFAGDGSFALYPIEGGDPVQVPHISPGLTPVQWSEDGSQLLGYRSGEIPAKVYRINISTGQETLIKELKPSEPAGIFRIAPIVISRDGKRFLYSYNQTLSTLWLISGLQ
ncbi:MAG TPA: protein kinase [Candidatus Sulfotelmatobacter sp.]